MKRARVAIEGVLIAIVALISVTIVASPAHAQEETIVASVALSERIPLKGRTTPNSTHVVSTTQVPVSAIGGVCDVDVVGMNNESVHPNSNIVIASANEVRILDVERESNVTTQPADGELTLGDTVTVSVQLGADGLFSGGTLVVDFSCTSPPPPTTTTTTAPPTTTTSPPTTVVKLGPPLPPVTAKCVENPATPALECGLPNTGARSTTDLIVGFVFLAVGVGAFFAGRDWVQDRRRP